MPLGLTYLTYYSVLVMLTAFVQILVAAQQVGLPALAGNREGLVLKGMALHLERATANSLFALALIAPALAVRHCCTRGFSDSESSRSKTFRDFS